MTISQWLSDVENPNSCSSGLCEPASKPAVHLFAPCQSVQLCSDFLQQGYSLVSDLENQRM